jgi:hypothetical protein
LTEKSNNEFKRDNAMSWFVHFGYAPAQTTPFNALRLNSMLDGHVYGKGTSFTLLSDHALHFSRVGGPFNLEVHHGLEGKFDAYRKKEVHSSLSNSQVLYVRLV